jgi:DNA-binding NarL/FixJ family response regulator
MVTNPAYKHRVLIVDDHPIVRHGLRRLIDAEPDLVVCGEAQSDREARTAIRELTPDVLIVDVSLAQGDGIDLVREVRAQRPELPMLVLSMHDETIYAQRMLAAGASGYIMKEAAYQQLLTALRRVLSGGIYLSEAMENTLGVKGEDHVPASAASDPIGRLSNRELQVLSLIGRGLSSREAAESLNVSVKTVESHRQSLKRKLKLATNAQLLQYSVKWFASRSSDASGTGEDDEGSDG